MAAFEGGQLSWRARWTVDIIALNYAKGTRRLPRKYRPPASRRRKSKRRAPYYVEPTPENGEQQPSAGEEAVSVAEVEPLAATVATKPETLPGRDGARSTPAATRHITRDYSYVRAEVKRILVVAGFLIIALIITALIRN